MHKKVLSSVLIKPAGPDCNLACTYCFYLRKEALFGKKQHRMSDEILENMVKQIMTQGGDQVSFGWQGGEPTLMGLDFYKKAYDFQRRFGRPGQVCGNGLQTNGILIDAEWARFLHDAKFLVGLSLDGPEHIHNQYRKRRGGQGCWVDVARTRDVLLEHDVEVNALIVVNDYSVQFPEEIYHYHKKHGLEYMQFIPCIEPGENGAAPAPFSVSAEAYGDFLITLFDLWIADFKQGMPKTFIRWFDSLFFTYVNYPAPECTLMPECGIYVVVEHNGDVYSCDFFVDPEWKLGNLAEDRISDLLNSEKQKQFGLIKTQMPAECTDCPWLTHCYGGCPKDRQHGGLDAGSNPFCESFKRFFEYADPVFQKIAEQWQARQKREAVLEEIRRSGMIVNRNDPCPCGSGKKFKKCCGIDAV